MTSHYAFPVMYVKKSMIDILRTRLEEPEVIEFYGFIDLKGVLNENSKIYVNETLLEYCDFELPDFEEYIEIIYDKAIGLAIDPIENKTVVDVIIANPQKNKFVLVKRNTDVIVIEARGRKVHALVREGDVVKENSRVFYIITKKYEVRVIRSPIKGIVMYIGEIVPSIPQRFVMVIVSEHSIRELKQSPRCRAH